MDTVILMAAIVGLVLLGMMTTYKWGHEQGYNDGLTDAAALIEEVANLFMGGIEPIVKDTINEIERRKHDEG